MVTSGAETLNSLMFQYSLLKREGLLSHAVGVFVRSDTRLTKSMSAVEDAGLTCGALDENVESTSGHVSIGTMHLAKGLEFRAVVVMACDDEIRIVVQTLPQKLEQYW